MEAAFERAKELYKYQEKIFNLWGMWPLRTTYVKFSVWIIYLMFHMFLECRGLLNDWGQLDLMVTCLSELTLEIMIIAKLFVVRFSTKLVSVMSEILNEIDVKKFESDEEREIYLIWNDMAKSSFRLWFITGCLASGWYNIAPLGFRITAAFTNESVPYVLPYRTLFFFEINDSLTFWLVWFYQSPMIAINLIHASSIGYHCSLVLHVCGQLSILSFRIKNLDVGKVDNPRDRPIIFRKIVEKHQRVVSLVHDINEVFKLPLLEELCISTVILGLTAYCVLLVLFVSLLTCREKKINSDEGDISQIFSFLLFALAILVLLYGYCVAGEYLITESTNVYNSYYECNWYNVSESFKKQIMICMIGASNPLRVVGGGFYIYNRASFMSILKTAMGYVSMLRTVA